VSVLFSGHPALIEGFNTFLPPDYNIECSQDPKGTKITVTTPSFIHRSSFGGNLSITGKNANRVAPPATFGCAPTTGLQQTRSYEMQGSRSGTINAPYASSASQQAQGQEDAMDIRSDQHIAHAQAQGQVHAHAEQYSQLQLHQWVAQPQCQVEKKQQGAQQQSQQLQQTIQQRVNHLQTTGTNINGTGLKGLTTVTTSANTNAPGVGERYEGPVELNSAISYIGKIKVSCTILRLRR